MLENWLHPISVQRESYEAHQFGQQLLLHDKTMPDLTATRIAIIGISAKEAQVAREALYSLSFPFSGMQVADLGNLRKAEVSFLIPVVMELLNSRIIPILIGNASRWMIAQFQAYQDLQRAYINVATVDEQIWYRTGATDKDSYYLNAILNEKQQKRYNVSIIGSQIHFLHPKISEHLQPYSVDWTGLGKARAELVELEPIIRDADLFGIHLSALRQSDAPAQHRPSPSGFFSEEACQLARYAGMSDKLTSFGIYGFDATHDQAEQTAQVAAQLIWYFIEGVYQRKQDYPVSTDGMVEYVVDFKGQHLQLTFWKSSRSGRWWLQVPAQVARQPQQYHLVSCSYNDYLQAGKGELPDRLLNALERYA